MRVVMDDAGDIPPKLIEQYNIHIVPINIMFGTEEYLSGLTMDHAGFYEKVRHVNGENFPKTSQPTPFQMAEAYRSILNEGEQEILTITVGKKLSGTYASAVAAAAELEGQAAFHIFDSEAGSAAEGYMALEAARMAAEGQDSTTILERLRRMRDEMVVVFTIDTLEFAVKSGRVSPVKSLMASMLNIKPILKLEDGVIVEAGRVRTRKKALDYIVDYVKERVGDRPVKLAVLHANAPDDAQTLRQKAEPRFNCTEEITVDMTIPVAIHLGPGALGLVAVPE